MNLTTIIKRPIITEKTLENAKLNRYAFEVDLRSTKGQIKEAVEQVFKVDVVSVRTVIKRGSTKRTGRRRITTTTSDTKKAIVQLQDGQTIKAFETKG